MFKRKKLQHTEEIPEGVLTLMDAFRNNAIADRYYTDHILKLSVKLGDKVIKATWYNDGTFRSLECGRNVVFPRRYANLITQEAIQRADVDIRRIRNDFLSEIAVYNRTIL